jgi:Cdc6-like AAA superfamily ATPase
MPSTLGRLLSYPFDSQVRSLTNSRQEDPGKVLLWFQHWENNLLDYQTKYSTLDAPHKDKLDKLQNVFEVIMERPFAGAQHGTALNTTPMANAFVVMEDFVRVVARGLANGLLVVGPGGTGKTWTVKEALDKEGKKEDEDYIRIPGYSTPLGLYNTLYQNQSKIIVFDDCDSVFYDVIGLNILKSVLDTIPKRMVSWKSASTKVEVPEFQFTGQIIFISNMDPNKSTNVNFQAVLTRVLTLVVGGTKEDILQRILQMLPEIGRSLTPEQQEEVKLFIMENYKRFNDLSLRLLVNLVALIRYNRNTWKTLALNLN